MYNGVPSSSSSSSGNGVEGVSSFLFSLFLSLYHARTHTLRFPPRACLRALARGVLHALEYIRSTVFSANCRTLTPLLARWIMRATSAVNLARWRGSLALSTLSALAVRTRSSRREVPRLNTANSPALLRREINFLLSCVPYPRSPRTEENGGGRSPICESMLMSAIISRTYRVYNGV